MLQTNDAGYLDYGDINPVAKSPRQSREVQIYLAIWRKGLDRILLGGELEIPCTSWSEAMRVKMGMYRAIKPYSLNPESDPILGFATEKASLRLDEGESVIVLQARKSLDAAERIASLIGIEEAELIPAIDASAQRILEALQRPTEEIVTEPKRSTPFYNR